MVKQQNQEIDRLLEQEVKSLEILKNKLFKRTEELLANMNIIEKEIEKQIQQIIQQYKNLKLNHYQIGQITFSQLQKMAQQISLFKYQDIQLFDQEVVDKLKPYQGIFNQYYDTALKHAKDYKKNIEDLIAYQQWNDHPQQICFDIQIAQRHNVIIANCENKIRSYSFKEGRINQIQENNTHRGFIETICLSNSQNFFFTGGVDKIVRVWKLSNQGTFELYQELNCHKDCIKSIVINSQDKQLFSTGCDKTIQIWNKCENQWQLSQSLNDHFREILQIQISQSDKLLLSVSWDRSINIYEQNQGVWKLTQKIGNAHEYKIFSACFINDEQFVTGSKEVLIWRRNGNNGQFHLTGTVQSQLECVDRIKYLPSNQIMIFQSSNALDVWRFVEFNNPLQIQRFKGLFQGATLTNNGQYLIAYNVDEKKIVINQRNF
ncbi:unnamed protein product [Paramecium octaurelia]|uniref:WD40-repeat-containing domain n=1 Tax=Paramecium octaurelia TaxID=43137 RepID=A0A8S1YBS0_PAROT|nr:unnamed protein product [Paramecium octaurelia]